MPDATLSSSSRPLSHELPLTEPRPVAPSRDLAEFPGYPELIGLVTGLVPFFVALPELEGGRVIDWVALVGGGLTLLMAVWAGGLVRSTLPGLRYQRVAAAIALVVLGVWHVARGVGAVGL